MKEFKELGINKTILKSINDQGFDEPTDIQRETIPAILKGKDVIASSPTGSGKTLAFACPIIDSVKKGQGVQAIVITPTRELALQVTDALKTFSKYKKLMVTTIYGGVSINPQIRDLKRTEVVVGTPGRVLDHLQRGTMHLDSIKVAVLDEADRMLDMGFIDDVNKILSQCPRQRQTLLYSATITNDISGIANRYMKQPEKVLLEEYVDPKKLKQFYYNVDGSKKFSLLVHIMKQETASLSMVFCNTRRCVDFVARNLNKQGFDAMAIHGGHSQAKRTRTMDKFHDDKADVLVCTDVAARGLHIENVSHVYNYDIPRESKQYIHRIGRTARAGERGKAINLLSDRDFGNFDRVLRDNDVNIIKKDLPQFKRAGIGRRKKKNKKRRHRNNRRKKSKRNKNNYFNRYL
ncbi:DEAD/DEAH box helicase [Candidatus Woesearchaeota archaeon]|nr:DEAD/DEAH box helicase [Candidatus Woesearchaeota archaeon]